LTWSNCGRMDGAWATSRSNATMRWHNLKETATTWSPLTMTMTTTCYSISSF
jgi:hypothetical protein